MQNALLRLKETVTAVTTLSPAEMEGFLNIWSEFSAKRRETITRMGEKEKYLYFVTEGVQRVYYQDEQGREATIVFSYPYSFGGVINAFLDDQPSGFYFEALTNSCFLRTSYTELMTLANKYPNIHTFLLRGVILAFNGVLERMVQMQCFSSEDKFRALMKRSPHILQLVPHKYLANYLGIDPTNFSKLINRIII